MSNLHEREGSATMSIFNTLALTIVVSEDGESVEYQYNDGEIKTAPIEIAEYTEHDGDDWRESSQPFFTTDKDFSYYIGDFLRNNF